MSSLGFAGRCRMAFPRFRMPVPASKMTILSPKSTDTQDVFPPKRMVSSEGVGILPRTPQNRIFITYNAFDSDICLILPTADRIPQQDSGKNVLQDAESRD